MEANWSPTNVSRSINPVFAPSAAGTVYATAPTTSDTFIAKFLPDAQTLVFATYCGGMGNDSGNSIALDTSGNVWITGTTSSFDFPVTPGAFQGALKGVTRVQVSIDGALSNILNVTVAPTALGLLAADGSGTGLANAQNLDGTPNSESNPAARGSVVTIF